LELASWKLNYFMNRLKNQKTFVLIKPDGVQRSLIGEIVHRFERVGLKFLALKMMMADEERLKKHYYKEDAWFEQAGQRTIKAKQERGEAIEKSAIEYGRDIQKHLVDFLSSGPVVMMVLSGNGAVEIVRKIIGSTEPLASDVGTIRGDFTIDSYELSNLAGRAVRNLIHASDSVEQAEKEINLWFTPEEILKYDLVQDRILYDVNLDGKGE
jgi:nucleoside-diphosphate kinase